MLNRRLNWGLKALLLATAVVLTSTGAASAAVSPTADAHATTVPRAATDTATPGSIRVAANDVASAGQAGTKSSGGIEEVVVTATKRAVNVQDVPFKVSALSGADLAARGAQTIDQAISYVPGVSFTSNGPNAGAYTIRGVNTSTFVAGTQSPVALYIDDLNVLDPFYPKVTPSLRMFDVNRVEVLEGPQGTLFGSGSLGGAIRIISNKPNLSDFEAETENTISNTDGGGVSYDLNGMVNIPLIQDKLGLRVVGYYNHDAGYIDNIARGENNVNHSVSEGARVELEFDPTSDLKLLATAIFDTGRPHDAPYSFYTNKKYEWDGLVPNKNFDRTNIYSLTGTYDFHWGTLTSISTYADRYENIQADFTTVAGLLLGINAPSPVNDYGPSRTFSQEVRLASSDDNRFRWLIGGIYINNRRTVIEPIPVPGSGALLGSPSDIVSLSDNREHIREQALFGEVSYDILPDLTATAGLRVFQDKLDKHQIIGGTAQPPSDTILKVKESSATPKFNLSYHIDSDVMLYAQVAKGYRIGQPNPVADDPVSHQPIPAASSPDSLWNYELGEKGTFLDGRMILNASIYYIDWSNIQLNQLTIPSGINFIGNAGEAHIKGAELELQAQPSDSWNFGGSLSFNDAKLAEVSPGVAAATKGDRLPGSARFSWVAYAQYDHPAWTGTNFFARVDLRWGGKQYSDLDNSTALTYGDATTLNLRTGLEWDRYTLSIFANNALNGDAKTAAFVSLGQEIAIRQRPTTYGLTFDAKF